MKYSIDISTITFTLFFLYYIISCFFYLSLFIFSDFTNKIAPVTEIDLNDLLPSDYYASKSNFGCVPEFEELALRLMLAHNLTFLTNVEEARQFYNNLLSYISIIENSWVEVSEYETFAKSIIDKYINKIVYLIVMFMYVIRTIHFNKFPWRRSHGRNWLENWLFTNNIYFLFQYTFLFIYYIK